jgi:2-polyprenyl-3-methyl-5-hydroxy-6-metoxy-1,4-benzoquinol methylase
VTGRAEADRKRWDARYRDPSRPAPATEPTPFVVESLPLAGSPPGMALDLAMGEGRNALHMARCGWTVVGVDVSPTAAARARAAAAAGRLAVWPVVADALSFPLGVKRWRVVLCSRYLERGLAGAIAASLAPGGTLLFETFTIEQASLPWGPRNPAYLLGTNELLRMFPGLQVVAYREGILGESGAVARLVARRPPDTDLEPVARAAAPQKK